MDPRPGPRPQGAPHALLLALFLALPGAATAQVTIGSGLPGTSTLTVHVPGDGTIPAVAQTFAVPVGAPFLEAATFRGGGFPVGSPLLYTVSEWMAGGAGTPLSPGVQPAPTSESDVTVEGPVGPLDPSQQYAVVFYLNLATGPGGADVFFKSNDDASYAEGTAYVASDYGNGSNFQQAGVDLAFEATFTDTPPTVVPEPATLLLVLTGLVGMGGIAAVGRRASD